MYIHVYIYIYIYIYTCIITIICVYIYIYTKRVGGPLRRASQCIVRFGIALQTQDSEVLDTRYYVIHSPCGQSPY